MIFQEVLSESEARVKPLRTILEDKDPVGRLAKEWQFIQDDINYHPIFKVAKQVLVSMPSNPDTVAGIQRLAEAALWVTAKKAALRHDLMGRIFHRLLAKAKPLGAYYTSIPAAALLLKLALDPSQNPLAWDKLDEVSRIRIADFACGTGTLVKAAMEAVQDNYIRAIAAKGGSPDLAEFHRAMVEDALWGFDVLPSAVHMAAAALALHEPDVTFHRMRLYHLPLGGEKNKLGSLEFLTTRKLQAQATLFGASTGATRVAGRGDVIESLSVPLLDLCVMNPPFVRSVGGNLLFGSLPEPERKRLQKTLAVVLRDGEIPASSTAGLGAVFAAMGDRHLSPGGHLALVLPRALLSGVAWKHTRELLSARYHVRTVIVSHEPRQWQFSENTNISEALIVARKLRPSEKPGPTAFLNLAHKPRTVVEALALAEAVLHATGAPLMGNAGTQVVRSNGTVFGELVEATPDMVSKELWSYPTAFAQTDLVRATYYLSKGSLWIPGSGIVGTAPMTGLGALGKLGPDRRDIGDGFNVSQTPTSYPAFLGHDSAAVTTLQQKPNKWLLPLAKAKAGRPLRDSTLLWGRAGNIIVVDRFRSNTNRVAACRLDEPVLSNTWWPFQLNASRGSAGKEKALVVWLNSTYGLLVLMANRVETQGPFMEFKKPTLASMPVLDVGALSAAQLRVLERTYDTVFESGLLPLHQIVSDPVRAQLDAAISNALGWPATPQLGAMLAREGLILP